MAFALPKFCLYWRMTRPAFLTVSALACALGWACAYASTGCWSWPLALITVVLALALHAAANVVNDVADAHSGGDALNREALAPFTGGAGFIQAGQVSVVQTQRLAAALLLLVLLGGLALAAWVSWGLLMFGALGLLLAWGYSAPPLALMRRGVGELAVAAAWLLMIAGADFVQRGAFSPLPLWVGSSYALLMALVLLVNGLPDAKADAAVGKRTLVVRCGRQGAEWVYASLLLAAHALSAAAAWVLTQQLGLVLLGQLSLIFGWCAWLAMRRQRQQQLPISALRPAIICTLLVVHGHGLVWCGILLFSAKIGAAQAGFAA